MEKPNKALGGVRQPCSVKQR
nr:hypothetical protein [Pseudomonas aeruginosa]